MRSHKLTKPNLNAVCLWSDLSPYPSTLEIVSNLEGGILFNNKTLYNYKINNKIYNKFYAKPVKTTEDLTNCKVVLFWNNPYYRILSEYLINCVFCRNITNREMSFASYIENKTKDLYQHEIIQIKNWILTNINQNIEQINIFVASLSHSIFSNLSLYYDSEVVGDLYKFLWRKGAYEKIKHLYKTDLNKMPCTHIDAEEIDSLTPKELLFLLTEHGQHYFESQTFFSTNTLIKINSLIKEELCFFNSIQINFKQ